MIVVSTTSFCLPWKLSVASSSSEGNHDSIYFGVVDATVYTNCNSSAQVTISSAPLPSKSEPHWLPTIKLFGQKHNGSKQLLGSCRIHDEVKTAKKAAKLISDGGYGLIEAAGLVKPANEKARLKSKQVVRMVGLPEACRTMKFVVGLLTSMLIDSW
ncbi:hypothetical protein ACFX1Z_019366 [Malus domestica]